MIGIVFCNDLNTCPYIDKYISVLEKKKIQYEIIIWNRNGDNRAFPYNYRVYNERSDIYTPRWKKIGAFIRFRSFLIKTIKSRKYDKLIMLTTIPAVMCAKLLLKEYRNRYIFDFRDLSYERFGAYKRIVDKIVNASAFTCLSSPGFAEALEIDNYVLAHNFRYCDLEKAWDSAPKVNGPINLLHIGITRGEEYNKKIASIFKDDKRFTVNIVGSGNDTPSFLEYTKNISNVNVIGTYDNKEKYRYISESTMLLYYYPCDFNCNRALANKYYDGMIYKRPLIGNINTYSGKRVQQKGIGISLDIDDPQFADKVFSYISNLNMCGYMASVDAELSDVLREDKKYIEQIERFLEG